MAVVCDVVKALQFALLIVPVANPPSVAATTHQVPAIRIHTKSTPYQGLGAYGRLAQDVRR